jgi:hypothetical protein
VLSGLVPKMKNVVVFGAANEVVSDRKQTSWSQCAPDSRFSTSSVRMLFIYSREECLRGKHGQRTTGLMLPT